MLSKSELKDIRSLHEAKGRSAQRRFVAEGIKLTGEMLGAFPCELLLVGEAVALEVQEQLRSLPERIGLESSISTSLPALLIPSPRRSCRLQWAPWGECVFIVSEIAQSS